MIINISAVLADEWFDEPTGGILKADQTVFTFEMKSSVQKGIYDQRTFWLKPVFWSEMPPDLLEELQPGIHLAWDNDRATELLRLARMHASERVFVMRFTRGSLLGRHRAIARTQG